MRDDVYLRHIKNNKNHWWFEGRKELIKIILKKNLKKKRLRFSTSELAAGLILKCFLILVMFMHSNLIKTHKNI